MREIGVKTGDRVAGYVGNHTDTLVAMLAATSIGAIWSSVSPDTGVHAVLERMRQIEPVLLFADIASEYNGKIHDAHAKVIEVVEQLPSLKKVVIFQTVEDHFINLQRFAQPEQALTYTDFVTNVKTPDAPLVFEYLPPDHPVYILYSSGTTGAPKPIVHGAMGTLIQHKKEHTLHCDIKTNDRLFYYTTTTWMMWHWLVSALASGATIVLYDGSPFRPFDIEGGKGEMAMPRLLDELQVTHFGTSAKYLSILEQASINPTNHPERPVKLEKLRSIFSTGSTLSPSTFEYVYSKFKSDVLLGSITGGTDIISLFGACCPILPVYKGEIQCRGLGMSVTVFSYDGKDISATDEAGDLVCTSSFPSQPVMFWPPGPEGEEKYRKSYFDTFGPGVWHHGDFLHLKIDTGGLEMLGRSDGVLKPAGVRFGSSEIYNVVLEHFGDVIEDSLCIGRRRKDETDETVVLFVQLTSGASELSEDLATQIKAKIRSELSPRHVPGIVDCSPAIPYTSNGKKIENVVKQILCGLHIKTGASVANPECLDFYRQWNEKH
ncbi:acetoacetyl-CoA synthase [Ascosphaera apis ARSEF 7405]|uniref:Acetoacetyl-CoA synthase n=1 Tax=Ascosphaera apis ARSEF 7405 TaxID=392613 RepID=A0A166P1L6_9EURO|nr:acetoacetyl-CoA synthase [Ascosphaera apis ARSEF 7405]